MKIPLLSIEIESIYKRGGQAVLLPQRMAQCTPDTLAAVKAIQIDLAKKGGKLVLSDMFRSYDMQFQAYMDWVSKKKKAYSPPPGGSMHEAGRAFDIDLSQIGISLGKFWDLAGNHGVTPIVTKPDKRLSEAWHFDKRGSYQMVYIYFQRHPEWRIKPYKAMATSAIISAGVHVNNFGIKQIEANIQFGLIRLGKDKIGKVDGIIGPKTRNALAEEDISSYDLIEIELEVENRLQLKFPEEYSMHSVLYEDMTISESNIV